MAATFKRILCPTDYSPASERAMEYALGIAQQNDAEIILVHVLHVSQGDMLDEQGRRLNFDDALKRQGEKLVAIQESLLAGYRKVSVEIPIGSPAEKILAIAAAEEVDLIVIGKHGQSGIAGLLLGGVADALVRHAPCPVMVAR